jgi:hypothetical protein
MSFGPARPDQNGHHATLPGPDQRTHGEMTHIRWRTSTRNVGEAEHTLTRIMHAVPCDQMAVCA